RSRQRIQLAELETLHGLLPPDETRPAQGHPAWTESVRRPEPTRETGHACGAGCPVHRDDGASAVAGLGIRAGRLLRGRPGSTAVPRARPCAGPRLEAPRAARFGLLRH